MTSAFDDDYTSLAGNTWIIQDHPSFEQQINLLASHLIPLSPEEIESYRSRAADLTPPEPEAEVDLEAEDGDGEGDDDGETKRTTVKKEIPLTPEEKSQRWELVRELVEKAGQGGVRESIRGGEKDDVDIVSLTSLVVALASTLAPKEEDWYKLVDVWSKGLCVPSPAPAAGSTTTTTTGMQQRYTSLVDLYNLLPSTTSTSTSTAELQHLLYTRLVHLLLGSTTPTLSSLPLLSLPLSTFPPRAQSWLHSGLPRSQIESTLLSIVRSLQSSSLGAQGLEASFSLLVGYLSAPVGREVGDFHLVEELLKGAFGKKDFLDFGTINSLPALNPPNSSIPAPLVELLAVLAQGSLEEFSAWKGKNGSKAAGELGLDVDDLERKSKLLALVDLGASRVGRKVSYDEIATSLNLDSVGSEATDLRVEEWVIEATKTTLLSARLNEPERTVKVSRAVGRRVEEGDWRRLKEGLERVRIEVEKIRSVVGGAAAAAGQGVEKATGAAGQGERVGQKAIAA